MAEKFGSYPNVLFELFNEPVKQSWDDAIKPYHEAVIPVIRQHTDNLIILGTRFWSQHVLSAAKHPVFGENLAYTVHFYASTHKQWLRDQVDRAIAAGITIFASEWGTCEASGNGALDLAETEEWLKFFEQRGIWDANWAVGDRMESCAALWPGASEAGNWSRCDLTPSGHYVRASLRGEKPGPLPTKEECPHPLLKQLEGCSEIGQDCTQTHCCRDPAFSCYAKNPWYAGCRDRCTPGIDPGDAPEYQTPWSCKVLTRNSSAPWPTPAPTPAPAPTPPPACVATGKDCSASGCCTAAGFTCFRKDSYWASCKENCTPGIDPNDLPDYQTPWSCQILAPGSR